MDEHNDARQTVKRRGILAVAGAVMAGIVAKQAAQPVAAAATMQFADTTTTVTNFAQGDTLIRGATAGLFRVENTVTTSGYALVAHCDNANYGFGVLATGTGYGVSGTGGQYAGVLGDTANQSGAGVEGIARSPDGGFGVTGSCEAATGIGVVGSSRNGTGLMGVTSGGTGVRGEITQGSNSDNTLAVFGHNQSGGANGVGVYGACDRGYGVLGFTTGGSASMSGISTNANIPAFAGGNSVAGGLAASFSGTVFVNGKFVVADMTQKHGLLKHPDGSHRLMYTVEAPESWAEDFGTGTLTNGKVDVKLDPDFAALIHTEDYHVFLTEHGGHNGLHTTAKGAAGFTVEADHELASAKGKSAAQVAGSFSWRVVAKPKSDNKVERLGKFVMPNVPLPDVSKLAKPVTLPVPKKP